jgi:hypothetical protein
VALLAACVQTDRSSIDCGVRPETERPPGWTAFLTSHRTGLRIFAEFREIIARRAGPHVRLASLERFAFYERTRGAFRVVATGEARLYGNILLKKGVVRPGGAVVPPAGADGSG